MKKLIYFCTALLIVGVTQVRAQEAHDNLHVIELHQPVDYYSQMAGYDLSRVVTAKTFLNDWSGKEIARAEILGYIGDDYQRLQIHFISMVKDRVNPYLYSVYGKTKVRNNICEFRGTITLKNATLETDYIDRSGDGTALPGEAYCDVVLYEYRKQRGSGVFRGELTSSFLVDKDVFRYNGDRFVADGFCNNLFVGTWTGYGSKQSKKVCWGDYRIPDSGDLDCGAAEFHPAEEYIKNGWEGYADFREDNWWR